MKSEFSNENNRVANPTQDSVPAFYKRRKKRTNEIGQVLLRRKTIVPEQLRYALRMQEEHGGQIGAILVRMGACTPRDIANALIEQLELRRKAGQRASLAREARANPSIVGLRVDCNALATSAFVFVADLAALGVASFTASLLTFGPQAVWAFPTWYRSGAITTICAGAFALLHLYAVPPPSPPEEMRRVSEATTLVHVGLLGISSAFLKKLPGSFAPLLLGWWLSITLVILARGVVRRVFAKRPWWGRPVVILGAGKIGRSVARTLQARPQLGLRPIAILDDDPTRHGALRASWGEEDIEVKSARVPELSMENETTSVRNAIAQFSLVEGVPIVGPIELAPALAQRLGIHTVIVALSDITASELTFLIEGVGSAVTNVLVVPDLLNFEFLGAPTRNIGGLLGVELRHQLLLKWPRIAKRTLDLMLTAVGGLFALPVVLLIALIVKLDSPGSVFYRQIRLGQDGQRFGALKFRTMYGDGERRLKQLLDSDPRLKAEYDEFHKLTVDPRITRAGRFLRKYSLDELPQIWNVLLGEMSLVGPRPYLEREIPEMEQLEGIILRVPPGITGMWQVGDRNASNFQFRIKTDVEYVRNWTPWLDLYILIRTFSVVITGTGS